MFLRSSHTEKTLWLLRETVNEIFKVSLIAYLTFYLIDTIKSGFISDYFNMNILLVITILSGIIAVWSKNETAQDEKHDIKKRDYIFVILLGLAAAGLIYYQIRSIGKLALVIAPISGVIIILLSILLLNDQENNLSGE